MTASGCSPRHTAVKMRVLQRTATASRESEISRRQSKKKKKGLVYLGTLKRHTHTQKTNRASTTQSPNQTVKNKRTDQPARNVSSTLGLLRHFFFSDETKTELWLPLCSLSSAQTRDGRKRAFLPMCTRVFVRRQAHTSRRQAVRQHHFSPHHHSSARRYQQPQKVSSSKLPGKHASQGDNDSGLAWLKPLSAHDGPSLVVGEGVR